MFECLPSITADDWGWITRIILRSLSLFPPDKLRLYKCPCTERHWVLWTRCWCLVFSWCWCWYSVSPPVPQEVTGSGWSWGTPATPPLNWPWTGELPRRSVWSIKTDWVSSFDLFTVLLGPGRISGGDHFSRGGGAHWYFLNWRDFLLAWSYRPRSWG